MIFRAALSPIDIAPLVHAAAGRKLGGAPVAIAAVTVEIAVTAGLAGRPMIVPVAVEALAPTAIAIEVAIAARLADSAVFVHLVPRTKARRTSSTIIGIATIPHFMTRTELRGTRGTPGRTY
ncbi:hypothetical protein [Bradyrhizobium sp.]|uniref:hypothetical protein n=1 Tax=Bradyrhizobium sp. TaxID=376 RepID=UPI002D5177D5|nr:hypothetical protein [Bradyrhizobium sp.]HZR76387.1 hypothetical protein [Bradyrhizobium sp.]